MSSRLADSVEAADAEVLIPAYWEYMQPTLEVLHEAGGKASNRDIKERVPIKMELSSAQLAVLHDDEGRLSEVAYRIAWACSYLKLAGLTNNQARGVWTLTDLGLRTSTIDDPRRLAYDIAKRRKPANDDVEADEGRETYLFAWNPLRYEWTDLDSAITSLREHGAADVRWSCAQTKAIPPGSRIFLIRLASEPRGIVGSGHTTGEVYEQTHWDAERAQLGERARFVDIRLDALVRTPLLRRTELDEVAYREFRWDTQASGIRIPADVASRLEETWARRLRGSSAPEALPRPAVERWREYWREASSNLPWAEQNRLRDEHRARVVPQISELVRALISGSISLGDFAATFDQQAKNEWAVFGLKGYSGAAFLNRLSNLSDTHELTTVLRTSLGAPSEEGQAADRINRCIGYLRSPTVAADASIQPNRVLFLLSACWHIQQPQRWPVFYPSARNALQADGLLGRKLSGSDGYQEFARVFLALASAIGISLWQLEHLCHARPIAATTEEDIAVDELRPAARIWLVSAGGGSELSETFFRDGVVGIGWGHVGDLTKYADRSAIRDALRRNSGDANPVQSANMCFQFMQDMQVGEEIFLKRGLDEILGYGVVSSTYRYEAAREDCQHVRSVEWKQRGHWTVPGRNFVAKRLTNIATYEDLVTAIRDALGVEQPGIKVAPSLPEYHIEDALADLLVPRSDVEEALELLRCRQNLVLQGPPGVGKTFFAKRLAYLLLEEQDADRVMTVQFHQSYAYEDFIQGYRPADAGGFKRVDGPFLQFCDLARQDPDSPHVVVIDEINRGNLSKIFGELMLLIEPDKRSEATAVRLTYSRAGERAFHVPKNVYIIGTMNTADRALAMIDYALRRRFVFVDMHPHFDTELARLLNERGVDPTLASDIQQRFSSLNRRIEDDPHLGPGFRVGHSYFCMPGDYPRDRTWYARIVRTEVTPLLQEYWFDNRARAEEESKRLLVGESR